MKCSHCGASISGTANFCTKCGAKLEFVITEQLIQNAIAGKQEAISELYNHTYNSVFQTVKAIIRTDEDTVLDLVQDTYIRGFKYLSQLDKAENFLPWIKRIGANTAKNYLKKKKPILFTDMSSEDDEAPELRFEDDRAENLPEVQIDQQETARLIGEILDSLSDEQRMAITMFYFNEMSVKEIAEELGCSENTVKSRLNYGRRKVKTKVEELEKKGTKLYSLAPLPFLLLLFRTQAAAQPDVRILSAVQKSCSSTAVYGAGAKTAAAAAKAGTKAISAKIIAGIAAAAVIATSAVTVPRIMKSGNKPQEVPVVQAAAPIEPEVIREAPAPVKTEVTAEPEATAEPTAAPVNNDHSVYAGIISDFEYRVRNQIGYSDGRGNAYAYYDLNNDGRDELLISYTYLDESGNLQVSTVCGIYTVIGEEAVQIAEGWSRNTYRVFEDGCILNGWATDNAGYAEAVLKLNDEGQLEETEVSSDSLVNEAKMDYFLIESTDASDDGMTEYQNNEESNAPVTGSPSFDEILSRVKIVIMDGIVAYETRPDQMEEQFSNLGEGIVWLLTHREQGVYTLDFFWREYDIDGDGENELLLGRGVSPSRVEPIAIYNLGGEVVVGDRLYNYSFPEDANSETPQWNYINPEDY